MRQVSIVLAEKDGEIEVISCVPDDRHAEHEASLKSASRDVQYNEVGEVKWVTPSFVYTPSIDAKNKREADKAEAERAKAASEAEAVALDERKKQLEAELEAVKEKRKKLK